MPGFKLLPATIVMALLFMVVKVVDVVRGGKDLTNGFLIGQVQAEASHDTGKKTMPKKDNHGEEGGDKEDSHSEEDHGKADAHGGDTHASDGHGEAPKADNGPDSFVSDTPGIVIDDHLSNVQIELLQKLAERRDELNRWEQDIQLKETVLAATEKRIDEKISQIENMQYHVTNMLEQYSEKEDTKISSLVKIYENMKPKDAARIFDEVDMPVLLLVIDKMSERKVAPILAGMDPKKAKELTVELAEQRKVDEAKLHNMAVPKSGMGAMLPPPYSPKPGMRKEP